jgi:hypothetical protein
MYKFICAFSFIIIFSLIFMLPYADAAKVDASRADKFSVLQRGGFNIKIDADLKDWALNDEILFMGKDTWEPLGGTLKNEDDQSAELKILYDSDNIYFGLLVKDDEYVAQGANPWENDGVQIAIDPSAGKIAAGWPNGTTHLYNFSIKEGWQKETGPFLGDAEIQMVRNEATKQTIFEWQMPSDIFAKKGTTLKAGMEIAFAIIINDSDKDAPGQTGWIGWGNHTIVFGKNPEEMKTLVLSAKAMSVDPKNKLAITWGAIK